LTQVNDSASLSHSNELADGRRGDDREIGGVDDGRNGMALKDLLVHLNSSKHCGTRLDLAVELAQRFDAHLTGVYTVPDFYLPTYVAADFPIDILNAQRARLEKERDRVKAEFSERMRKAAVKWEWRALEGNPSEMTTLSGRYADLVVVGQNDPDEVLPTVEFDVPESVILDSGRPTLVVPYAGKFPKIGERVLVAWNARPEASRAVNDALPLMAGAKNVTVLVINPKSGTPGHGDMPGADIALHLARHGIKAEASQIPAEDIDVGNIILSRAADAGADLIVMGAYGHARLRELVLGGATRTLLDHMTVAVLMSH